MDLTLATRSKTKVPEQATLNRINAHGRDGTQHKQDCNLSRLKRWYKTAEHHDKGKTRYGSDAGYKHLSAGSRGPHVTTFPDC